MQNFSQIGEVPWPDLVQQSEIITLKRHSVEQRIGSQLERTDCVLTV